MTKCVVEIADDHCTLIMEGHATGSEQVCAACSTLSYTLAGWVMNNRKRMREEPQVILTLGSTKIVCRGDDVTQEVFRAIGIGLMQIAAQHPQYCEATILE